MHRHLFALPNLLIVALSAITLATGCLDTAGLTPGPSSTSGGIGASGGDGGAGGSAGSAGAGGMSTTACTPKATQSCYSGPAGTSGVGICAAGTQTCLADGSAFGPCEKEVLPLFDDCSTPGDEDCDGTAIAMCTGGAQDSLSMAESSFDDVVFGVSARNGRYAATGVINGTNLNGLFDTVNTGDVYVGVWKSPSMQQWSVVLKSSDFAVGRSVALYEDGGVIAVGEYSGTLTDSAGMTVLPDTDGIDIFVIAFDTTGKIKWAKNYTGPGTEAAHSVALDATGDILFTGEIGGDTDFGCGPITPDTIDVFVTKLDKDGNCIWSKSWGSTDGQTGRSIAVAPNGDVVFAGAYRGDIDFGKGILASAGGVDAFLARLDGSGATLWSKRFGDYFDQFIYGVATGPQGEIAITGPFDNAIDFGGGKMSSAGSSDMFLAAFDSDGKHRFSKKFGDIYDQFGTSTAIDGAGHVANAGIIRGDVDFGGGVLPQGTYYDASYTKFSPKGVHEWSGRKGDGSAQVAHAVAIDEKGYVIIGGGFEETIDFGNGIMTSTGGYDMFVVRLAP